MKLTCSTDDLRPAVNLAATVLGGNPKSIEILRNTRLAVDDGLTLLATNLDCWLYWSIPAHVSEPGSTTVDGQMFDALVRGAPDSSVALELGRQLGFKSGKSTFRLPVLAPDQYPPAPEVEGGSIITCEAADFRSALQSVEHVKTEGYSKWHGVRVRKVPDGLECATFDGGRFSVAGCACRADSFEDVAIPLGAVGKLVRLLDEGKLSIRTTKRLAEFRSGPWVFTAKLCEEQSFPAYWEHLAAFDSEPVMLSAKELAASLGRIRLLRGKSATAVKLSLTPDNLALEAVGQGGEGREELCVGYSGDDRVAGFNVDFLADAVRSCPSDEAELRFNASSQVMIFPRIPNPPRHILAPMRV